MTRWIEPQSLDVPPGLRQAVGGHPLVAEMLVRRGIVSPQAARAFLDPAAYTPAPPTDLPHLERAVERLQHAVQAAERILIWGDFDADGQTATALLLENLRSLGAQVTYHVPGRDEGHGVHPERLRALVADGAQLILTCDTGVTAHAAVEQARRLGAEVIITDHHVPDDTLPPAVAVIDPHLLPAGEHPLRSLTGAGVAYQLARALDPQTAERSLDLVALGTVADVGTLSGDNRYLVQRGLEALRHTERLGLRAIYQAADLRPEGLTEEHIGFVLGPRFNALGRLADARHGVELLTTGDATRAHTLATEVEGLNARRQWLTRQVTEAALARIEREPALLRDHEALVLAQRDWPSGIVGIVASRLAERFGKPTVLISAPDGQLARGSGRSVPGVDLIAALSRCAPLLQSYGGHAGAAGFAIEAERIPELRVALSRAVAQVAETIPEITLTIDAYVELPDLDLELVSELSRLAPFGPGNPPPTLAVRDLRLLSETTIGRTGEHRRITVEDAQERTQTVFWWQGAGLPLPQGRFDLALSARASDFRGVTSVQLEWLDAREQEPLPVPIRAAPAITIRDYRSLSNPRAVLNELLAEGGVQIWAEAEAADQLPACNRLDLEPGTRLAIWTLPPGPRELQAALERVQPREVIFFANDPGADDLPAFGKRLAGMVKHALRAKGGRLALEAAAAATAQRVTTVKAGLEWLAAQGQVQIADREPDCWHLTMASGPPDPQAARLARARLKAILVETAAYRHYACQAPAEALLPAHGLR